MRSHLNRLLWDFFMPLPKRPSTPEMAQRALHHVFQLYSIPGGMVSDQVPKLTLHLLERDLLIIRSHWQPVLWPDREDELGDGNDPSRLSLTESHHDKLCHRLLAVPMRSPLFLDKQKEAYCPSSPAFISCSRCTWTQP